MIATTRILTTSLIVAFLAVCTGCEQPATATTGADAGASTSTTAAPRIVYVNVDSLQSGYTIVADELKRLEANYAEAEANINKRVQALQQEVQGLQARVQRGELPPVRVQEEQQRIGRKEQEIVQQRDLAMQSIQQDQMRIQQTFSDRVKDILDDIQAEEQYDYILNRSMGSPVLIARDEFDITKVVLERLNAVRDSL